jgi:hypothetical protein
MCHADLFMRTSPYAIGDGASSKRGALRPMNVAGAPAPAFSTPAGG